MSKRPFGFDSEQGSPLKKTRYEESLLEKLCLLPNANRHFFTCFSSTPSALFSVNHVLHQQLPQNMTQVVTSSPEGLLAFSTTFPKVQYVEIRQDLFVLPQPLKLKATQFPKLSYLKLSGSFEAIEIDNDIPLAHFHTQKLFICNTNCLFPAHLLEVAHVGEGLALDFFMTPRYPKLSSLDISGVAELDLTKSQFPNLHTCTVRDCKAFCITIDPTIQLKEFAYAKSLFQSPKPYYLDIPTKHLQQLQLEYPPSNDLQFFTDFESTSLTSLTIRIAYGMLTHAIQAVINKQTKLQNLQIPKDPRELVSSSYHQFANPRAFHLHYNPTIVGSPFDWRSSTS